MISKVFMENKENNRILAQGKYINNNTWETGLNNNDLIIGVSGRKDKKLCHSQHPGKQRQHDRCGYQEPALQNAWSGAEKEGIRCRKPEF